MAPNLPSSQDISEFIEIVAKRGPVYELDSSSCKMASRLGTAEAIIFMLILCLSPRDQEQKIAEIREALA
jgi:hypothetical protein